MQVLDIVRAAESLALGVDLGPPKSPIEPAHHENLQKTTTIVMSKHTLNTLEQQAQQQPPSQIQASPQSQVCPNLKLPQSSRSCTNNTWQCLSFPLTFAFGSFYHQIMVLHIFCVPFFPTVLLGFLFRSFGPVYYIRFLMFSSYFCFW